MSSSRSDVWFCRKCGDKPVKKTEWLKHKQMVHDRYLNTDSVQSQQYAKVSQAGDDKNYWICAVHKKALNDMKCGGCGGGAAVMIRRSYYDVWEREMRKLNDCEHVWISPNLDYLEWYSFVCVLCGRKPQDVGFYPFGDRIINYRGEFVELEATN